MKKILPVFLLLGIVGVAFWMYWPQQSPDDDLVLYGNVDIRDVRLGFRVGGRLDNMYFEEGQAIRKGDLLATLDTKPYEDGVALAAARVAEAKARVAALRTGSRPQEIQQAEAGVAEASAARKNAQQDYRRQKELVTSGVSSQRLLDAAKAQLDQTQARLEASREALALAVEGARSEDVDAGEAALAAAQAQLEQAKTQVDDGKLIAPSNGVILTRVLEPGSIVGAGATVYSLSLTDKVYVRAYVAEPDLGRIAPGTEVNVTTDSSDDSYVGHIGFISPRAEFTPKTVETQELRTDLVYRVRIVMANTDEGLRQGMPVTIRPDLR